MVVAADDTTAIIQVLQRDGDGHIHPRSRSLLHTKDVERQAAESLERQLGKRL